MTLVIYLLFLSIAAIVLYIFPYSYGTIDLLLNPYHITFYLQLLALEIAIVWVLAIAALHWPIWNYYRSSSNVHGPDQKTLLELMLPHQDIAYFTTSNKTTGGKKWYILIFLGLSTSIVLEFHRIF